MARLLAADPVRSEVSIPGNGSYGYRAGLIVRSRRLSCRRNRRITWIRLRLTAPRPLLTILGIGPPGGAALFRRERDARTDYRRRDRGGPPRGDRVPGVDRQLITDTYDALESAPPPAGSLLSVARVCHSVADVLHRQHQGRHRRRPDPEAAGGRRPPARSSSGNPMQITTASRSTPTRPMPLPMRSRPRTRGSERQRVAAANSSLTDAEVNDDRRGCGQAPGGEQVRPAEGDGEAGGPPAGRRERHHRGRGSPSPPTAPPSTAESATYNTQGFDFRACAIGPDHLAVHRHRCFTRGHRHDRPLGGDTQRTSPGAASRSSAGSRSTSSATSSRWPLTDPPGAPWRTSRASTSGLRSSSPSSSPRWWTRWRRRSWSRSRRQAELAAAARLDAEEFAERYVTDAEVDAELARHFPAAAGPAHSIVPGAPVPPAVLLEALDVELVPKRDFAKPARGAPASRIPASTSCARRSAARSPRNGLPP